MSIQDKLTELALELLPEAVTRRQVGRKALVSRVRNGKIQMNHPVSEVNNFKIVDGKLVMMKPEEIRRRKRAARIAARKRSTKMSQILRKRSISMNKRKARFGA